MKKIIIMFTTAFVSTVMVSNVFALDFNLSSYSIDELRIMAKQITVRIQELEKAKLQTCFVSNSTLSLGDGEAGVLLSDVKNLQDFLREKANFQAKSTGYFGKLTRTSLLAYQASVGVPQTGEFDTATREKAHASSCSTKNIKASDEQYKSKSDLEKKELERKEIERKALEKKEYENKKSSYYESSTVTSILLSSQGKEMVWTTSGYAKNGYKLIASKSPSPTYPPREGDRAEYYEAGKTSGKVYDFAGSGLYYVRICEYLDGKCGVYSNEIKVEL